MVGDATPTYGLVKAVKVDLTRLGCGKYRSSTSKYIHVYTCTYTQKPVPAGAAAVRTPDESRRTRTPGDAYCVNLMFVTFI